MIQAAYLSAQPLTVGSSSFPASISLDLMLPSEDHLALNVASQRSDLCRAP